MFQLRSPTTNYTFFFSLAVDLIFLLKYFFSMERSMLQYLLLYLFWGLMNSAISPWTLPIIFHATGAWPKEGRTWNTASSSCSKQKNSSKPGFNSSWKRKGTRVFCFPENFHFWFHFLLDLISAQDGQFRGFRPKQTPLFSRPQIPGLEMCFQFSTTLAGLVVKETWKPENWAWTQKGLLIFTKTSPPFIFLFFLSFFFFPFLRISGLTYGALNI